ncbi:RICIN domain-containing protein [Streptomyces sp. NPDC047023]|uniref:RICIN domain-containing protein n=1 Tax=Streptomyces sp. NPDC047023 TaxID=3155139 RepID=UPI0034112640
MTPSADAAPLVLRAFRSLPPSWQTVLCPSLADPPAEAPAEHGDPTERDPSRMAVRGALGETYLRLYVTETSSRACRHVSALLDDAARGPASRRSDQLESHFAECRSCPHVYAELNVLHRKPFSDVTALLHRAAEQAAQSCPEAVHHPSHAGLVRAESAESNAPSGVVGGRRIAAAVAASPIGAAAVAGVLLAALAAGTLIYYAAHPADDTSAASPRRTGAPPGSPSAEAEPSAAPAGEPGPASDPGPTLEPGTTAAARPPAETTERATQGAQSGFRLVNVRTGLCAGAEGPHNGAALLMQACSGKAWQRWEAVDAGAGRYQLFNTGTHKCLDGTGRGGNVVRVVQNDCLGDAASDRHTQLWMFAGQEGTTAFRLKFVPPVSASDYPHHLLGPGNWWEEAPPPGSPLVQLPDYYASDAFLFSKDTRG